MFIESAHDYAQLDFCFFVASLETENLANFSQSL